MSLHCSYCQHENRSGRTSLGGTISCERCGSKIDSGHGSKAQGSVGIHPVLARRYGELGSDNPTRVAQSRVIPVAQKAPSLEQEIEWPKIPGYELIERIGKGAMGSVFRATHLASRRETAVKILAAELTSREDLVARFEREAAALRSFRHPNIVAIYDSGSYQGTHYYAMEYILGTTLRRFIKISPLAPKVSIKFARQIVQALKAAHDRGIIHRDLKPENIIIEAEQSTRLKGDERLVLVDFGLAGIVNEAVDPHPNLTHSRVTMGTVNYMAPEQHVDAKRVDFRSDLYAAGVILYECLTGDLPLGRFRMPREKGVAVPPSVDALLIKALARSPAERFQNADDFDSALVSIETELETGNFDLPAESNKASAKGFSAFDTWNVGIARERPASLATVFPTKYMNSPIWANRPVWLAATVALAILITCGIFIANRTPREVAVSSMGAAPVFAKGNFEAPMPHVRVDKLTAQVGLSDSKKLTHWESESPVWGYQDDRIGYRAKQGDVGHFRRDFSLAVAPEKLPLTSNSSYSAHLTFERVVLPVDLTKAQVLARETLGASPESPAGGIFLVNKKGKRTVGMVVFADGSCSMTQAHAKSSPTDDESRRRSVCRAPLDGKSIELKLQCDAKAKTCTGFVGGQKVATESVESMEEDAWHVALGCRNINCLFDSVKDPKPKA